MKNKLLLIISFLLLIITSSCSKEDPIIPLDFAVAFEYPSVSFKAIDTEKEIILVFSMAATQDGTITVKYDVTNAEYGVNKDFITEPLAKVKNIILNVKKGDIKSSFKFKKLINPIEGTTKIVNFTINSLSFPLSKIQGNTNLKVSFTPTAALGGNMSPEIGGSNEPNQVYIDLSSQTQQKVKRDTWDLGFYSGDDFRVTLNGAIFMGAAELNSTDINAIKEVDVTALKALIKTSAPNTAKYFDDPTGDITKTVITEISSVVSENKVYLLKLGYKVGTTTANTGSVALSGELRGWKKIRILRKGNGYTLQYADIDATTFKEKTINKDSNYNLKFFSFDTENEVIVEPKKDKWDLNFTVFTNVIDFGGGALGAYGYSDYIVTNLKGTAKSYMLKTDDFTYEDFKLANINEANFKEDQRAIGSSWRNVFSKTAKEDRFYVLKDASGNYYKIKFNALVNESGLRGYTKFEYVLLK